MASSNNSAVAGDEAKNPARAQMSPSPRTYRRSWSTASSPTCGGGGPHGGVPKCVCAPATHAGSFKCRLHRTSSHGHQAPMPRGPSPAVNASSTRTVEAQ